MNENSEYSVIEIKELLQSFCMETLPQELAYVYYYQSEDSAWVKFIWHFATVFGTVNNFEVNRNLEEYVNEHGISVNVLFLGDPITENALRFCAEPDLYEDMLYQENPFPEPDVKKINLTLLEDKNVSVLLTEVNLMLLKESRVILGFHVQNKSKKHIRVWIKELAFKKGEKKEIYNSDYISIAFLQPREKRNCRVVLDEEGLTPFFCLLDMIKDATYSYMKLVVAYDYDKEEDVAVSEPDYFRLGRGSIEIGKPQKPRANHPALPSSTTVSDNKEFVSVVVLTNAFKCEANHTVEDIEGQIDILNKKGEVESHRIFAGYCKDCNKYFIDEIEFERLKKHGVLLCRLIADKQSNTVKPGKYNKNLKMKSELREYGYTVDKEVGLTPKQRQSILKLVLDNGFYKKYRLCDFLNWLIREHTGQANMEEAISKWQEDRDFVASYKLGKARAVGIKEIHFKEKG